MKSAQRQQGFLPSPKAMVLKLMPSRVRTSHVRSASPEVQKKNDQVMKTVQAQARLSAERGREGSSRDHAVGGEVVKAIQVGMLRAT